MKHTTNETHYMVEYGHWSTQNTECCSITIFITISSDSTSKDFASGNERSANLKRSNVCATNNSLLLLHYYWSWGGHWKAQSVIFSKYMGVTSWGGKWKSRVSYLEDISVTQVEGGSEEKLSVRHRHIFMVPNSLISKHLYVFTLVYLTINIFVRRCFKHLPITDIRIFTFFVGESL